MKLTPEQQKERDTILADMEVMRKRLDSLFEPKPWPQVGDHYIYLDARGVVCATTWTNDGYDRGRNTVGNVYPRDRQAYAQRHSDAMCVLASLRAMPGRTVPPRGDGCLAHCILRNDDGAFIVSSHGNKGYVTLALGGVWFSAKESAGNALSAFTTEQLEALWDDHLQTPIGGV